MAIKVKAENLAGAVAAELEDYSTGIRELIRGQTLRSMKKLVDETKATAPVGRRKKHYRDSITSTVTKKSPYFYEMTWHVKPPDYRLSHLLNNGHQLRNGGRYPGTAFITKASVSVIQEYVEKVEDILHG